MKRYIDADELIDKVGYQCENEGTDESIKWAKWFKEVINAEYNLEKSKICSGVCKNKVKFYIPDSLQIPTDLALYVGETYVTYERIKNGFRFNIYEDNIQKAMKIANQIADIIIYDHDECQHGVTWETLRFQLVEQEERYRTCTVIKWYYRIRDSY